MLKLNSNGEIINQVDDYAKQIDLNTTNINVTNLTNRIEASAEIARDSIPSGFVKLGDIDYTYMFTNPNSIKLSSDSVAYINGYKTTIPSGTTITLNSSPTTGTRDDLVFLECWKQADVNGVISWNSRIRVVDGVEFTRLPEGLGSYVSELSYAPCLVQGGNPTPINNDSDWQYWFRKSTGYTINGSQITTINFNDTGLYVAGIGDTKSKTLFNTSDGYIYAIPMLKVHRRNSGGYSISNGNGSREFWSITGLCVSPTGADNSYVFPRTLPSYTSVGDKIYWGSNGSNTIERTGVITNIQASQFTVVFKDNLTWTSLSANKFWLASLRQDNLYVDIVVERDILDLRHQVSLTGFNYQQLLEENFDKLLRGELQTTTKTTMLKTYHGIPKTTTDANTIFYASLDGTLTAEIGGSPTTNNIPITFESSATGLSLRNSAYDTRNAWYAKYTISSLSSAFTIDSIITNITTPTNSNRIIGILTNSSTVEYYFITNQTSFYIYDNIAKTTPVTISLNGSLLKDMNHIRIGYSSNILSLRINGNIIGTSTISLTGLSNINTFVLGNPQSDSTSYFKNYCNIAISNVDRGSIYTSLPQDFIDGYAKIMPSFNEQRQIQSDALTSEYKCEIVRASGETKRQYTITQATSGTWASGDTLKVKGLLGEIVSGVIDTDTGIAKVIQSSTAPVTVLYLNDVSKFVVNDTIKVYDPNANTASNDATITSIDTVNKTITVSSAINNGSNWSVWADQLVIDTTITTSSPTVKATVNGTAQAGGTNTITLPTTFNPTDSAYNGLTITIIGGTGAGQVNTINGYVGSTKVATVSNVWTTTPNNTSTFSISNVPINGTWTNLGTNQAIFTLGTLYALTNQSLQVEYSLNEIAGQGGISEVLTTTLGGEFGGKKLTVNPSVHIRDDFYGKVSGSVVENPNIAKHNWGNSNASLLQPSVFPTEYVSTTGNGYSAMSTLNGNSDSSFANTNGSIPQQLFSFNLIEIVERKYGTIPALDIVSKIAWLKANISNIVCNTWSYGSCPSGNKAYLKVWDTSTWSTGLSNTSSSPSLISLSFNNSLLSSKIDSNGFVHFLTCTDASNGTIASTLYTDYCNIEVVLNTPTGYDVLSPENPRRDDGKSNLLLVQKETKTIRTMFGGINNANGIVTYGDYVPFNGNTIATGIIKATSNILFLTSGGTGGVRTNANMQYADTIYKLLGNNVALYNCINNLITTVADTSNSENSVVIPVYAYWGGKKFSYIGASTSGLGDVYPNANDLPSIGNYYVFYSGLKSINGEMTLIINGRLFTNGKPIGNPVQYDFKLSNRPMIK